MVMGSQATGLRVAGTLFGVVAIVHVLRLLSRIDVRVGSWEMPFWVNVLGVIVTATLCGWLWMLSTGRR